MLAPLDFNVFRWASGRDSGKIDYQGLSPGAASIRPNPNMGSEPIIENTPTQTRVESSPGGWSRVREELPLSMRVHELAKELGMKSQELLDRIQREGLDVKLSALGELGSFHGGEDQGLGAPP